MKHLHALVFVIAFSATTASAVEWSLPALEEQLEHALTVQIAAAETSIQSSRLAERRARSGWKIVSGVSLADNEESTGIGGTREFKALAGRIGLQYPLFGSRLEEQLSLLESASGLKVAQAREEIVGREALELLRRRYIRYWMNQRKLSLVRRYIDQETSVMNILDRRRDEGLLLEADRLEFAASFDATRSLLAKYDAEQAQDLAVISALTGQPPVQFVANYPELAPPCLRERALLAAVQRHPELEALAAHIEARADERYFSPSRAIESNVSLTHAVVHELPEAITGTSATVNMNIRLPLNVMAAAAASRDVASAELSKARLDYQLGQQALEQKTRRLLALHRTRRHESKLAQARLAAKDEDMREKDLRAQLLPGDVQEQLQQAYYRYFEIALTTIEAESLVLDSEAQLLALAPQGCALARSAGHARASNAPGRNKSSMGVYLWQSHFLLAQPEIPNSVWDEFAARGIDRLLVSLDGAQIEQLQSLRGATTLQHLISAATRRGFTVELLLAEPTWILPAYRAQLLTTIERLSDYDFAALHLDLEPNQLEGQGWDETQLLEELIATLAAAKNTSPWPIGFSVHPRYMGVATTQGSFGERLAGLDLAEITLMAYVANPRRVHEITAPLLETYAQTKFSIAQSIEDFLPPEETHAKRSLSEFHDRMDELAGLFDHRNFNGILVQAWRYYRYMSQGP